MKMLIPIDPDAQTDISTAIDIKTLSNICEVNLVAFFIQSRPPKNAANGYVVKLVGTANNIANVIRDIDAHFDEVIEKYVYGSPGKI